METQFEIHSRLEKKHYVEYYRYIWRKRIIWVVLCGGIGLVGLLLNLKNLSDIGTIIQGCALVAYAVWVYFRPWLVAGKVVKRESKFDGKEIVESVTKFGDEILDATSSMQAKVSYDKLKAFHIAEHVIVLQDIRRMDYILDKNGFTKGTLEDFMPFIQEKCPQLNLPKW